MTISPFFAFVLALVIPGALIILLAALLWTRRTSRQTGAASAAATIDPTLVHRAFQTAAEQGSPSCGEYRQVAG
jgi:hypothetical protein